MIPMQCNHITRVSKLAVRKNSVGVATNFHRGGKKYMALEINGHILIILIL